LKGTGQHAALIIFALILLIRLPFLNQAVSGDDVYYLAAAEHAQVDPAHPNHVHYIFEGRDVDFRGYPHPPLNAWSLAALIALFGAVREIPFHAAYIAFSLISAFAMWSLAKRFSPHPLWATLLFCATPAFVINGNSFESDVPFLAFWLAGIATFVSGRYLVSAVLLTLASLAAPQVVLAVPILAVYTWINHRRSKLAWFVTLIPVLATAGWQTFEFLTDGRFPAAVSASYQQAYGYQKLAMKLRNAGALSVHALFLVFPPLLLLLPRPKTRDRIFLYAWAGIFFAGAVALFFAGSARYLLPMSAPVALLVSQTAKPIWLKLGFACSLTLSLLMATANYQHWNQVRTFARSVPQNKRTWVNAEWGLRHYLEQAGALPVQEGHQIPPGDQVVSSELGFPIPYAHAGSVPAVTTQQDITPVIPLRLIGLDTHSAYSTAAKGFLPFGISTGPVDRLKIETLVPKLPTHEFVNFALQDADDQIASGIYGPEGNPWRWMSKSGTLLLKTPAAPTPIQVHLYIPDSSPVRTVTLTLDGAPVITQTFPGPGTYTIETSPQSGSVLTITADKSFSVPSDHRELGIILSGAGFQK
jgi:hypothetical protein